ncbi:hypothetical protein L2E82_10998 [Cichorium intybus]|uniref:Uncharacterized protein n=1 Tax=Cichorium intybus TaxID=13427 RepID=A0ACB9GD38_CICIN|nr:hypothetical protein L2E82_10998 [Cichorium intybus]
MSGEVPPECDRVHQALLQCHRRVPSGPSRQAACRHLNRSLAECMIAFICPDESAAFPWRNLSSDMFFYCKILPKAIVDWMAS